MASLWTGELGAPVASKTKNTQNEACAYADKPCPSEDMGWVYIKKYGFIFISDSAREGSDIRSVADVHVSLKDKQKGYALSFFQDAPIGVDILKAREWALRGRRGQGAIGVGSPTASGRPMAATDQKPISKELVTPEDSNPLALLEERKRTGAGGGGLCSS